MDAPRQPDSPAEGPRGGGGCAIALVVLLAVFVGGTSLLGGAFRSAAATPDLLLVTIEGLRADHLGPWGDRSTETPALDRLARAGLVVSDAFTPSPGALAALGSIHTGRLPRVHGQVAPGSAPREGLPTLGRALAEQGFATAAWLERDLGPVGGAELEGSHRTVAAAGDLADPQARARFVRSAVAALDAADPAQPLFLWLHLAGPVWPAPPAPDADPAAARAAYAAAVEALDRRLAPLVERALRPPGTGARGPRELVTVLVGTSGVLLGEHGLVGGGARLEEPVLRVPLLVHRGSGAGAGEEHRYQAFLPDLAPTLLDLAGVDDLYGLHRGGALPLLAPEVVDLEGDLAHGRSLERLFVHEAFGPGGELLGSAVRLGSSKWLRPSADRPEAWHELSGDPQEDRDLLRERDRWDEARATRWALLGALTARWEEQNPLQPDGPLGRTVDGAPAGP